MGDVQGTSGCASSSSSKVPQVGIGNLAAASATSANISSEVLLVGVAAVMVVVVFSGADTGDGEMEPATDGEVIEEGAE